jgi:UPF0755 protein
MNPETNPAQAPEANKKIPMAYFISAGAALLLVLFLAVNIFFVRHTSAAGQFNVPLSAGKADAIAKLKSEGVISAAWPVRLALFIKRAKAIEPGGYQIPSAPQTAWELAGVLSARPHLRWAVIPEGLRKEEIAAILEKNLDWTADQKAEFISKDTSPDYDHTEGVYFPETYLIPAGENPSDTAKRLRSKFEEEFAPYAAEALKQNIRWPTLLKVASLVQREAAGPADMPVIAGILWNRLLAKTALDIDATLQYIKGGESAGWWPKVSPADKSLDSLYNTYRRLGLPPHPIDNPGLQAIKAALYPEKTDCLYYLHDKSGVIHCSKTYAEHQANIEKYLK